jgi:hypothetical protein
MKRIGIEPGRSFDLAKADPAVRKALEGVPQTAQKLMQWKVATLARVANHWSMNTDTMGVYGNYYLKRAIVAQVGLGANLPEDAIYPLNLGDETGRPLDGSNKYTIHFDKNSMPPVNAFWSVTRTTRKVSRWRMRSTASRSAAGCRSGTTRTVRSIYLQNESPGKDNEANWLPAPKGGFNLTMRLYGPSPRCSQADGIRRRLYGRKRCPHWQASDTQIGAPTNVRRRS